MNFLVINGSPKGEYSITLQTVRYLEAMHPEHRFTVLHAGQRIKMLEKDFSPAMTAIAEADAILFSYPVYTFLAPCQLHRFIELMKEHNAPVLGKYASQITTSKHFYDVTAHRYIQENCRDMGMLTVRGLSADMEDLLKEKGRQEAETFWQFFCWSMEKGYSEEPLPTPPAAEYIPATQPTTPAPKETGNVVIVADLSGEDTALAAMIERFRARLPRKTRLINLQEYPFKGGCLGCFHCASDGTCIYKDGFDRFLREDIQTSEAIIYAFTVRDHSMGALFKMYDDRQFCNGHRTVTIGSPVGYLIHGSYRSEINLQTVLEGRSQVGGNFLAGIATDEEDTNASIDRLADTLHYALENRVMQPQNFYGVGGMKIFRDLIFQMQGLMKADHRFFKAHGQYDFPQKNMGTILKMQLVGKVMASPAIRAKMGNAMNEGMIAPYRKVLEKIHK